MVRKWLSPSAVDLAYEMRVSDPEAAIERKVQSLLARADYGGPPTNLNQIASYCGIMGITLQQMPRDGQLVGDRIFVNSVQSIGRQRFTIAHEIVHTLIPEFDGMFYRFDEQNLFDDRRDEVERLCDAGAAEMLVPLAELRGYIHRELPSIDSLERLATTFAVSLEVMVRQIAKTNEWRGLFVFLEPGRKVSEIRAEERIRAIGQMQLWGTEGTVATLDPLRVRRSFVSSQLDLHVHWNKSIARDSSINRCLETGVYQSGREHFSIFREGDRELDVESVYVPYCIRDEKGERLIPRVLSLLLPTDVMDKSVSYE